MKQVALTIISVVLSLGILAGVVGTARASELPVFQFRCGVAKTATMDPITDDAESHRHVFYGNTGVRADSTYKSLVSHKGTTCLRKMVTTSYWHPMVRFGGERLEPRFMTVYYSAVGDLKSLRHIPDGLQMIGNEANGDVDYICGAGNARDVDSPPYGCEAEKLRIRVDFPKCWDRGSLRPESLHEGPSFGSCPAGMAKLPRLRVSIHYDLNRPLKSPMRVSAGGGEWRDGSFMHADAFEANQQPQFNDAIESCVMKHNHSKLCTGGI
jgi:hypothetical protein